jgi:hypothetical protein
VQCPVIGLHAAGDRAAHDRQDRTARPRSRRATRPPTRSRSPNNTGITLSTANGNAAVFKDPRRPNLDVSSVTVRGHFGHRDVPGRGQRDGRRDAGRGDHDPVDGRTAAS